MDAARRILERFTQRLRRQKTTRGGVRGRLLALRLPSSPWLLGVIGLLVATWVYCMVHGAQHGMGAYDFSTYYAAARALRLDPHSDIYAQNVLAASAAAGHVSQQPPLPYAYPPLGALLLIPLTLLPFAVAVHIWVAINITLWLVTTLLLAREIHALLMPTLLALPAAASRP
ncbi:MAG TPA: glycosyltransferase 87 family protein, partial [Ktedonobacterales bacterium]